MALTAEELRINVRQALGNPSEDAVPDGQLDTAIDFAYAEALTRFRHPELQSTHEFDTVSGTIAYALPTDYWYTVTMKDEDNIQRLVYRRIEWLDERDSTATGQPRVYTRHGSNWRLYPTPDAAYDITVRYMKRSAPLRGSGTTVFDGIEWDEIVKWGAVWRVHQDRREQDAMIHTRNIWRTLVGGIPETETLEGERATEIAGPLRANIMEIESL